MMGRCSKHVFLICNFRFFLAFWPTKPRVWNVDSHSVIPSPLLPALVIALDVSLFLSREVHARWSTSRCSPECCDGSRIQDSLLFTTHKSPPNHSLMDVIAGSVFSQTFGPRDGADPTFRIAFVRAFGCINKRAKVRWSRWRWSSLVFTLFLQLQGFCYWPAVVLLHPWCATLTPEVRPEALNTWFDLRKIENMSLVLTVLLILALCAFNGKNYSLGDSWMDDACLQCTCLHPIGVGCCETWVLKQFQYFWFLFAWKYKNKSALKTLLYTADHPGCTGLWTSLRGVRCGWSRLPAACPWSRQRTPVCPASPVKTSRTPATDCLSYSRSRGRTATLTSISLWK